MNCPFCSYAKFHKHGKTSKGSQRYRCAACRRTFTATFDTPYYRRQLTPEQVEMILQAYADGSSLRGISRIEQRAYGTVANVVRQARYTAQSDSITQPLEIETSDTKKSDPLGNAGELMSVTASKINLPPEDPD